MLENQGKDLNWINGWIRYREDNFFAAKIGAIFKGKRKIETLFNLFILIIFGKNWQYRTFLAKDPILNYQ